MVNSEIGGPIIGGCKEWLSQKFFTREKQLNNKKKKKFLIPKQTSNEFTRLVGLVIR